MVWSLFPRILTSSAVAGGLVLVLLALKAALGRRLPAAWHHALWLLVLVKLLAPVEPASRLSVLHLNPLRAVPATLPSPALSRPASSARQAGQQEPQPPAGGVVGAPMPAGGTAGTALHRPAMIGALQGIWLSGAAVFGLAQALLRLRLAHRVRRGSRRWPVPRHHDLLRECGAAVGVARRVRLLESRAVGVPGLFGLLRPAILLPARARLPLTDTELRRVFLHELAHYRRADSLWSLLAGLAGVVHWFNPLAWYAFRRMRQDAEEACDAVALSGASEVDRGDYGRLVIHVVEALSGISGAHRVANAMAAPTGLRNRISRIVNPLRPARTARVLALLITPLLGLTFCTATPKTGPVTREDLLAEIEEQIRSAHFHEPPLEALATVAATATHNFDAVARAAYVISHVGYHTGQTLDVARMAAGADRDEPAFRELVDLTVRALGGQEVPELARQVARGEVWGAELAARMGALRARADLRSLDEAVEYSSWLAETREPPPDYPYLASVHSGLVGEMLSVLRNARHNRRAILEAAHIISYVPHNTSHTEAIARLAGWVRREIPDLRDLVELSVLLRDGAEAQNLAVRAVRREISRRELAAQISALRAAAPYHTVGEVIRATRIETPEPGTPETRR